MIRSPHLELFIIYFLLHTVQLVNFTEVRVVDGRAGRYIMVAWLEGGRWRWLDGGSGWWLVS